MNRILCGALLLEELILLSVDLTENLNIRSTSLKTLQISRDRCMKTVVVANTMLTPNLLSLDISACIYGTCLLDVPSSTDANICLEEAGDRGFDDDLPPLQMFDQFFQSLRHVENLSLWDLSIEILLDMNNHMVGLFSNTKFLKLYVYSIEAKGLLDVLGMFPELMSLVVKPDKKHCSTIGREPQVAMVASNMTFPNLSLLQLKTVEITWSKCAASIIPMVQIMLGNAPLLNKMVLQFD